MCLAIPGKIISFLPNTSLKMGKVSFAGIVKEVCLEYVPEAKINDYVLVHVGFAISIINQEEAKKTFEYLEQIGELEELQQGEKL